MPMDQVRIASTKDITPGKPVAIEAMGLKLMLTQVGEDYFVTARKCPHLGFNLCRGSVEGRSVVCPLHKAKFDLETGEVERDPKLLFINMKTKTGLKTYPVKVLDQDIFVGV
jgi:nitrite reductase/ring-hydroxylating ferredoxin subunit